MKLPFLKPAVWPEIAPGRFAAGLRTADPTGCRIALLGLPDDKGVRLNKGRPGAAQGPAAFRSALARLGAASPAGLAWPGVFDAGDVAPGRTLQETHRRITEAATSLHDLGLVPVAVGGGHDLTFPFVRAAAARFGSLKGLYFDAHLDVRETPGSGMAFRCLLEQGAVSALHLHGFRPFVNSQEHLDWFLSHGGHLHPEDASVRLPAGPHLFASFDLDVLDASCAPGVSAMNPAGWTVGQAERWVHALGASSRVRCFDLMELSPPHDEGGRTARVAAHLFLSFLAGFSQRP